MKRIIALAISLIFVLSVFVGCMARVPSGSVGSDGKLPDTSKFIGEERAKQIALEKAGISSDGASFVRLELDRDDGIWKYEVEIRQGRTEYDIDIKADSGEIISFETDYND